MILTSDQIKTYLTEQLNLSPEEFNEDTLLFSTGLLDSLNLLEVVTFLEKHIGRRLQPREITLAHLDSISRILAFVSKTKIK